MSDFHRQDLLKPDGRRLLLYSRKAIASGLSAPSPRAEPVRANPHLRWHPLRAEWVDYATHRQDRTFLPPKEYNPLMPMKNPEFPTELPVGEYDVAVFENLFPSMSPHANSAPELIVPTQAAKGVCEVVVFTQNPESSLGQLSLSHIELLIKVWADRYREISADPTIKYVMPFENRGIEMGVTLNHPHGQIYAYPVIPPIPRKEMEENRKHFAEFGKSLVETLLEGELADRQRVLFEDSQTVAWVPVCARYTYETWIAPKKRVASLADLDAKGIQSLARALKTVLLKFDGLWGRPFPYLMAIYQAPTDGETRPEAHLRFEFYPPYRTSTKLKFLAGTELGAGLYANDSLPEEKAAELKAVAVDIGDLPENGANMCSVQVGSP